MCDPLAQVASGPGAPDWVEDALDDLVEYLSSTYNVLLRRELLSLVALGEALENAADGDAPRGLAAQLNRVAEQLLEHMAEEERVVFPMIAGVDGAEVSTVVLERVQREHAEDLANVLGLVESIACSADASFAWRALCRQVRGLRRAFAVKVRLEHDILFPRACANDGQ